MNETSEAGSCKVNGLQDVMEAVVNEVKGKIE
jgi:hypothetical protein